MWSLRRFLAIVLVCVPLSVEGVTRLDHKKLSVSYLLVQPNASSPPSPYFRRPNATEPPELRSMATFSADYDTYEIFEVALQKLETFVRRVKEIGFRYSDQSSQDWLHTYGGSFNTRSAVPIDPSRTPRADYKPGQYGLYLMKLVGPSKEEWRQELTDLGVVLLPRASVPVVGATPAIAQRLNELPYVQFIEPFHPSLKERPGPTNESLVWGHAEHAEIPGWESARDRVRAVGLALNTLGNEGYFDPAGMAAILAEPAIVGVRGWGSGIIVSAPPPPPRMPPELVPTLHSIVLGALAGVLLLVAWWSLASRP